MNSQSLAAESTHEKDTSRKVFWILGLGGSIAMLYYEYLWARFALRNHATVSFGGWFWTSLVVMTPWNLGVACVRELRKAAKEGRIGWDVPALVQTLVFCAYSLLTPEICKLMNLGALK
jgi:hypothetical protein